jgi:hypothetical protein
LARTFRAVLDEKPSDDQIRNGDGLLSRFTMAPPTEAQGKAGAEEEPQLTQDTATIQIVPAVNPYMKKKTDPPPPPPQAQNVFQLMMSKRYKAPPKAPPLKSTSRKNKSMSKAASLASTTEVPARKRQGAAIGGARARKKKKGGNGGDGDGGDGNESADGEDEEEDSETQGEGAPETKSTWSKVTKAYLAQMLKNMKREVYFEERGTHALEGKWLSWHFGGVISATSDPISYLCGELGRDYEKLTREEFSLPDVMFWSPERRWPKQYPAGRPCCPFHPRQTDCVDHIGWTDYPRRAYARDRNVALFTTKYRCKKREKGTNGIMQHPYTFHATAAGVLCQAPPYVQAQWKLHGFILTKKAAVQISVMDHMRSMLANGSGAAGFQRSIVETYKQRHASVQKMWTNYTNQRFHHSQVTARDEDGQFARTPREVFFDFNDPMYDTKVPSLKYLLQLVVEEIERRVPYYNRKMQMNGGENLSSWLG